MAALVIDASIALAWGLPDETSNYADAALIAVEKGVMHVPQLWPYEIANGLATAHRRQRITSEDERLFLAALSRLTIRMPYLDVLSVIGQATASAIRFGLTAYDSAYVNLALREGVPLATLDARMRKTAVESGVTIFTE